MFTISQGFLLINQISYYTLEQSHKFHVILRNLAILIPNILGCINAICFITINFGVFTVDKIIIEGKKDQYGGFNTFEVKDDYIIWTAKTPDGEAVRSIDRLTGEMIIEIVDYKDGKKLGADKFNCEKFNKKL